MQFSIVHGHGYKSPEAIHGFSTKAKVRAEVLVSLQMTSQKTVSIENLVIAYVRTDTKILTLNHTAMITGVIALIRKEIKEALDC
ncbi:MAG TPA: hypothetical protein VFW11_00500 [Cyclobacteriaceae bacterium]|nr:hypothetical protein [Cyclobacteriaceae bacterium]